MKKKYLMIIILFISIHNHSQVRSNFNKKNNSKNEVTYYKNGITNYKLKKFDAAIIEFSKAIEINSKMYNYYYLRGSCYLENKKIKKAISDFNIAIKLNSNNSNSYSKLGYAYYQLNDYISSSFNYNKSLDIDPNNSNTYYYQSLDFELSMQKPEKKEELLTKAIDFANSIDFNSNFEKISNAYYDRGIIRLNLLSKLKLKNLHNNSFDEKKYLMDIILDFTNAIKNDLKFSDAYYQRGLIKKNKLLNDAIGAYEDFDKAIKFNPSNGNAYIERGYLKLNIYNDGNGSINDLIKSTKLETDFLHPKEITYTAIGIGLIELGRKIEGCKYLSKAGELGYEEAFNYINTYCN
jgi:tetratricopeptide (TPR) repeat protein